MEKIEEKTKTGGIWYERKLPESRPEYHNEEGGFWKVAWRPQTRAHFTGGGGGSCLVLKEKRGKIVPN